MITQEWQFIILVVGWLIGLIPAIMAWNDDIFYSSDNNNDISRYTILAINESDHQGSMSHNIRDK